MGRLPDRWLPYSSVGQPIEGTKFIAFKVPLKEAICRNLKPDERFTPTMLVEQCPRLSLVVDLTNTHRYYNPREFLSKGILYEKIFCPGKVIPHDDNVQRFIDIVDDYEKNQNGESKESLIGVHCTHGLNRTAYFICNYMIKRLKIPAQEAISAFEHARGHPIERQEYVKALIDGVNSESTPKPHADLESPLGSLYEERPITNKYSAPRQRYQPRPGPEYFNRDHRRGWNRMPNDQFNGHLPGPARNGYHNRQQNIYGNNFEQRQFVRGDRRYGNDSVHSQSIGNEGRRPHHFSTLDQPSESQDLPNSSYRKRHRNGEDYGSGIGAQPQKRKFQETPRFVRLGEGLASSSLDRQPHPTKYRTNIFQKGRPNSFLSRQPRLHSESEAPFQGSDKAR